jgi:hypothetical protein
VQDEASTGGEQVHAAEVIAALCLATDLGMGLPFEYGLEGRFSRCASPIASM